MSKIIGAKDDAKGDCMAEKEKKEKDKEMHNKDLGIKGEDAAARYLENKGYKIIDRN